jgi:uncharacterized lipoprotein YddW (UPF0748 family)
MVHQSLTRRTWLLTGSALALSACTTTLPRPDEGLHALAPAIPREFRGAWVATVANIDWPSKKGLSTADQQAEIRNTVALAASLGLNALLLQVRTSADALYPSNLEPWSEYLSGTQGQAPDPAYDPLALWIAEAHARGLELHAWFNPYRARQSAAQSPLHASHLSQTRPGWVKTYGKQLWIDPGEPEAAAHTLAVMRDVLSRYALDGLHIDDYFYPYPEKDAAGNEVDFPDEPSWQRFGLSTGLSRADWRRQNVDRLVEAMFRLTREVRPGTQLGISPFGLMRPDARPPGIAGFSQYDKLYADVERWLREGWLDYLVPQLYWPRAQAAQAFGPLLQGWLGLNPQGRHVWPGLYTSRINAEPTSWQPEEISGQVALTRELHPQSGHVHFSMAALTQNRRGVTDHLRATSYNAPALPPASAWIPAAPPPPLRLAWTDTQTAALLSPSGAPPQRVWRWWRVKGAWRGELAGPGLFAWPKDADALVASAIGANGLEGPRQSWLR